MIKKHGEKGFTLIELLVVVAIIGLLASVVLASLSTAREQARDAERISDLDQISTALELYYSNCGQYPNNLDSNDDISCGTTINEFIDPVPTPPSGTSSSNYSYATQTAGGDNVGYCLGANLENDSHNQSNGSSACPMASPGFGDVDYYVGS